MKNPWPPLSKDRSIERYMFPKFTLLKCEGKICNRQTVWELEEFLSSSRVSQYSDESFVFNDTDLKRLQLHGQYEKISNLAPTNQWSVAT